MKKKRRGMREWERESEREGRNGGGRVEDHWRGICASRALCRWCLVDAACSRRVRERRAVREHRQEREREREQGRAQGEWAAAVAALSLSRLPGAFTRFPCDPSVSRCLASVRVHLACR